MTRLVLPGGFRGVPSPDGRFVAFGNGTVGLLNAETGERRSVGEGYPAGWRVEDGRLQLAVSRNAFDSSGNAGRLFVFLDAETLEEFPSGIPVSFQAGWFPTVAAQNGWIVSSWPGTHFVNGQKVYCETSATRIEDFDGFHYLYKLETGWVWPTIVRNVFAGRVEHRIEDVTLTEARVFTFLSDELPLHQRGAWIMANLYGAGHALIIAPDGERIACPPGEGRGVLTEHQGMVTCWTVTNEQWTPVILGRELAA